MRVIFHIRRRERGADSDYMQDIPYIYDEATETVASALLRINSDEDIRDAEGKPITPIEWECSCLQKRCGACAMRINGQPRLACDAFLREYKDGEITLEPLRKFPCIADLRVDRSAMREALSVMRLYRSGSDTSDESEDEIYDASRCLQCGLCLEVCPNYMTDGDFYGMAAAVPYYRRLSEQARRRGNKKGGERLSESAADYRAHIYEGCAKSLACRDVCPAGIDIDRLLVKSSRAAIWRRRL